jgi:hypothetical protein
MAQEINSYQTVHGFFPSRLLGLFKNVKKTTPIIGREGPQGCETSRLPLFL